MNSIPLLSPNLIANTLLLSLAVTATLLYSIAITPYDSASAPVQGLPKYSRYSPSILFASSIAIALGGLVSIIQLGGSSSVDIAVTLQIIGTTTREFKSRGRSCALVKDYVD